MQRDEDMQSDDLEGKILNSNPLLEAYGNAVTVRNNNSSRFGKWTVLEFNSVGMVTGCHIKPYLLEKSRVAFHTEGERNYHCFYHLFEAAKEDKDLLTSLELDKQFNYMIPKKHAPDEPKGRKRTRRKSIALASSILPGQDKAPVQDNRKYRQVRNAFHKIGLTAREVRGSYELLAGILHLGEVSFEAVVSSAGTEACTIKDDTPVTSAARILGIDKEQLAFSLTRRKLPGLDIHVRYNCDGAMDARDALAKALYEALFHWMVHKINLTLRNHDNDTSRTIGVLDIFGFECFLKNGFEQLCINYSNEKLHFFFNDYVFRMEKVVYEKEKLKIDGNIEYVDNSACLKMFENRSKGIFALLDDVSRLGESSDAQFLQKQKRTWKKSSASTPRLHSDAATSFRVKHYAGDVSYNVTGFLKRNADALHPDLAKLISTSTNGFVNGVVQQSPVTTATSATSGTPRRGGKKGKKTKRSIGTQFQNSLKSLVKMLNSTTPHFIRCLKPNPMQKPSIFQSPMVLNQLRQLGFLSVCQIRQNGYPVRLLFAEFWRLYQHCLPPKVKLDLLKNSAADVVFAHCHTLVEALCKHIPTLAKAGIQVGTTMVFMKDAAAQLLRQSRDKIVKLQAIRIQAYCRRYLARCMWLQHRACFRGLANATAARDLNLLEEWLVKAQELLYIPYKIVADAQTLRARIVQENAILEKVRMAMKEPSVRKLGAAIRLARKKKVVGPEIEKAKAVLTDLQTINARQVDLRKAIESRDKKMLKIAIDSGTKLAHDKHFADFSQTKDLLAVLETSKHLLNLIIEEQQAIARMAKAVASLSAILDHKHTLATLNEVVKGKAIPEVKASIETVNALAVPNTESGIIQAQDAIKRAEMMIAEAEEKERQARLEQQRREEEARQRRLEQQRREEAARLEKQRREEQARREAEKKRIANLKAREAAAAEAALLAKEAEEERLRLEQLKRKEEQMRREELQRKEEEMRQEELRRREEEMRQEELKRKEEEMRQQELERKRKELHEKPDIEDGEEQEPQRGDDYAQTVRKLRESLDAELQQLDANWKKDDEDKKLDMLMRTPRPSERAVSFITDAVFSDDASDVESVYEAETAPLGNPASSRMQQQIEQVRRRMTTSLRAYPSNLRLQPLWLATSAMEEELDVVYSKDNDMTFRETYHDVRQILTVLAQLNTKSRGVGLTLASNDLTDKMFCTGWLLKPRPVQPGGVKDNSCVKKRFFVLAGAKLKYCSIASTAKKDLRSSIAIFDSMVKAVSHVEEKKLYKNQPSAAAQFRERLTAGKDAHIVPALVQAGMSKLGISLGAKRLKVRMKPDSVLRQEGVTDGLYLYAVERGDGRFVDLRNRSPKQVVDVLHSWVHHDRILFFSTHKSRTKATQSHAAVKVELTPAPKRGNVNIKICCSGPDGLVYDNFYFAAENQVSALKWKQAFENMALFIRAEFVMNKINLQKRLREKIGNLLLKPCFSKKEIVSARKYLSEADRLGISSQFIVTRLRDEFNNSLLVRMAEYMRVCVCALVHIYTQGSVYRGK